LKHENNHENGRDTNATRTQYDRDMIVIRTRIQI